MNTDTTTQTIVTVTTAAGRPTLTLPGEATNAMIADLVQREFGMQQPDASCWGLPHSFCARIEPEPERFRQPIVGAFGHTGLVLSRSMRRRQVGC